jgi:formylglycine-generating enzyme required for sulfatase activity
MPTVNSEIFLSNSNITSVKLGNTGVSKIFLGNNIVFEATDNCPDSTSSVKMTGWVAGDRILAPIGYAPYGRETYTYGDEVVRYETGVWLYINATYGELARAYSYAERPWLVDWPSPYTAEKVRPDGTACGSTTTTTTTTVAPTTTTTTTPAPFPPGSNYANFNTCADWDGQNGNLTTVGTNGGPSAYGTFDQSGGVNEWNDLDGVPAASRGRRGGTWFEPNVFYLSSTPSPSQVPTTERSDLGFRVASSYSTLNPSNFPNFVVVGDVNNAADTGGAVGKGSVGYLYAIGQYLITNSEYVEFLNAVAKTDTAILYSVSMGLVRGGITRSGASGNYTYTIKTNYGNKPVMHVGWFDCARYCNWLHNGKPTGSQNNSTTEDGAYTLNGAISGNAVAKNAGAKYHIPTENEWYKSAFYKGGGTNAGYWKYATQSNTNPTCVNADASGNGIIP